MFSFAAEALNTAVLAKGIMMGFGMFGPAIGIGMIGAAFMNAVGRNPEASKYLGQVLVIIAIIELMALLVFASVFIIK
ncbi:ATP synthase F0 subunit C [Candidatus Saccharibacteria bacterium]|jgi:F0F1-type ATP synthase membrane subunit c/vacuolar-type H+-ATPase subunit K|nr:ATP synthase F0 subunit C [Candidatus Saccharibacteria bacterium]MCA9328328.1 ATP synthase F0 subunit C [Candidatus Saccharibacteria bacterium]